jgi:type IV pilus assembly protein PilY1
MSLSTRKLINKVVAIATLFCMTTQGTFARYLDLSDVPLFIGANVPPQVMLTISKEQQLFKKAYNDYSDLDEDGQLETTYKHAIDYYGYFDSYKCYTYDTGSSMFQPAVDNASKRNTETDDKGKPTAKAIADNMVAKYCGAGSGQWSGNFLNWVSMSRMDTVRKLLYGGMRSTDTGTATVLERAYLPTDAHAWAKYYPGKVNYDPATGAVVSIENDIDQLTPFSTSVTTAPYTTTIGAVTVYTACAGGVQVSPTTRTFQLPPYGRGECTSPTSPFTILTSIPPGLPVSTTWPTQEVDIPLASAAGISIGDQIRIEAGSLSSRTGNDCSGSTSPCMLATVTGLSGSTVRARVNVAGIVGATPATPATASSWRVTNVSSTGISFCNATIPTSGVIVSQTNRDPPLMRVARGNFSMWNANEKYQCYWKDEASPGTAKSGMALANGGLRIPGSNGNQYVFSEIAASAENPTRPDRALGGTAAAPGDFVVRVATCVKDFFGTERCKQYPSGNYKPIGLLQEYGDVDLIQFGLMTGSFKRNISGGVLRKNVGSFTDEVNVLTDGTFTTPAVPPGSPRTVSSTPTTTGTTGGIVSTLNYLRIYGYNYAQGDYRGAAADNCTFQLTNITEDSCTSWGNPMSEIFFESLSYFAGKSANTGYTFTNSGSKDNQLGLPLPDWRDPLTKNNYCAPLNVLLFNASVSTNDDDLRDVSAATINSGSTVRQLTNVVGDKEGITYDAVKNNIGYFVGKILGSSATPATDVGFELCSPKNIPGLGDVSGVCPEGPTVAGSYLMAGLAHHARTNRIRTDISIPSIDARSLKVTTYGIQLATNVPTLTIPVPGSTTGKR